MHSEAVLSPKTFQKKYHSSGAIGRRLVDGFFAALGDAVGAAESVSSALEVGCGEGISTARIRKMLSPEAVLHASDINRDRLAAARERNPGVAIAEESIVRLSRTDASFDLVLALEVLEHVADPEQALAEVCRVSKRWVIFSVPREPIWRMLNLARLKYVGGWGNTPGHLNHWSRSGFTRFAGRYIDVRRRLSPFPWTMLVGEIR